MTPVQDHIARLYLRIDSKNQRIGSGIRHVHLVECSDSPCCNQVDPVSWEAALAAVSENQFEVVLLVLAFPQAPDLGDLLQ